MRVYNMSLNVIIALTFNFYDSLQNILNGMSLIMKNSVKLTTITMPKDNKTGMIFL